MHYRMNHGVMTILLMVRKLKVSHAKDTETARSCETSSLILLNIQMQHFLTNRSYMRLHSSLDMKGFIALLEFMNILLQRTGVLNLEGKVAVAAFFY